MTGTLWGSAGKVLAGVVLRRRRVAVVWPAVAVWLLSAAATVATGQEASHGRECALAPPNTLSRYFARVVAVTLQDSISNPIGSPQGLAWSPTGRIALADGGDQTIRGFNPDGTIAWSLGRRGQGPGEFLSPVAVAFSGDTLLAVVDDQTSRLTMFDVRAGVEPQLLKSLALPNARFVGSVFTVDDRLVLPGHVRHSAGWYAATVVSPDGRLEGVGQVPEAISRYPGLLSGPALGAPLPGSSGSFVVALRYGGILLVIDSTGSQRVVTIPPDGGFGDPVQVMRGGGKPARPAIDVSVIMSLVSVGRYVVVGYLSPGSGARTLRYKVFSEQLRQIQTVPEGGGIPTQSAPFLLMLRGQEDPVKGISYTITAHRPCPAR